MVKVTAVCLALLMILSLTILGKSRSTYAREAKESHKLVKGLIGVVTAPIEVPKQIYKTTKESNILAGITVGTLKGVGNLATKVLSGVFNIVTCIFPEPVAEVELFPEEKAEPKGVK